MQLNHLENIMPAPKTAVAKKAPAAKAVVGRGVAKRVTDGLKAATAVDRALALPVDGQLGTTYIDPKLIDREPGWNPRTDFGEIPDLAGSIKSMLERAPLTGGLVNDIRVKAKPDGRYELVDGDRRLTAIEYLMKSGSEFLYGIPAKVEGADASPTEMLIRMFTANTGKQFLPMEEAVAFKRMKAAKMTNRDIHAATGRSHQVIVSSLALLESDASLQQAVVDKKISTTDARGIAQHARGDKGLQAELTAKAVDAKKNKDKKGAQAVRDVVTKRRVAKAVKTKRVLKMRALNDTQLSMLGEKVEAALNAAMSAAGMPADADMVAWVRENDADIGTAFMFGVMSGLKAAAGLVVPLTVSE